MKGDSWMERFIEGIIRTIFILLGVSFLLTLALWILQEPSRALPLAVVVVAFFVPAAIYATWGRRRKDDQG